MTTISSMFDIMWIDIWGNSYISGLALLGIFAFLCFKKRYTELQVMIVMFPIIFALTDTSLKYIDPWFRGAIIGAIGGLWGYALFKLFASFEMHVRIYVFFMCVSLSFVMMGYTVGTSGAAGDFITNANKYIYGATSGDVFTAPTTVIAIASTIIDVAIGGGIMGFMMASGIPSQYVNMIAIPVSFMLLISIIPLIKAVLEIANYIFQGIATGVKSGISALWLLISKGRI